MAVLLRQFGLGWVGLRPLCFVGQCYFVLCCAARTARALCDMYVCVVCAMLVHAALDLAVPGRAAPNYAMLTRAASVRAASEAAVSSTCMLAVSTS